MTRETNTLLDMLSYRRPGGSRSERRFIREFIAPLGMNIDKAGNLYKRVGDVPVLWSCHTDTVHRDGGRQHLAVASDIVLLGKKEVQSNCLGADDTAGVFLMCEMIKAERPGLYIFHRGEESGGIGSRHIATNDKALVEGIEWAIALDRKGVGDIITHQFTRCCSDDFAKALASKLGGKYKPDSGGIFTDTANYTDLIGECTNISVGYYAQHTKGEMLSLEFIMELRGKLLDLDVDLPSVRKPGESDYDDFDYTRYYFGGGGRAYGEYYGTTNGYKGSYGSYGGFDLVTTDKARTSVLTQEKMSDIVYAFPEETADILMEFGMDAQTLLHELEVRGCDTRDI